MHIKRVAQILAVFIIVSFNAATAVAWPYKHGQKARVQFLATSTLIRGTCGRNEDTYLAQLLMPKQNEVILVRLVDAYPNEWPPLAREVLMSDADALLLVRRDTDCDRPYGEMILRTAPGDPLAILPERLGYQPPLGGMPTRETILPCYRVLRR